MDYNQAKGVIAEEADLQRPESFLAAFARKCVNVPDQAFHRLMEAVLVAGERIHAAEQVDRDVMASLWALAYWTRSFGVPSRGNYASQFDGPPPLKRADFNAWLDVIEGTVLGLLHGSSPRRQVGRYAEYLRTRKPGENQSFFVKLMIEALEDDREDCPTDLAVALAKLGAVSALPALRKAAERTYGQDDPWTQQSFDAGVKRVLHKAIRSLEEKLQGESE